MMIDPCKCCYMYPDLCPAMCTDKMKYMNEVDGEVSVIKKCNKPNGHFWYERGKKYEMGKNGIRREIS